MTSSGELPTLAELKLAADRLGMVVSESYLQEVRTAVRPIIELYARLDELPDDAPSAQQARSFERPAADRNPHNAWIALTAIKERTEGPLAGVRVAIKDNICVAGVPMGNGGALPDGYAPEVDATVVTRILDAGGEIAGKAACEFGCISGGSHTGRNGPVHNPCPPSAPLGQFEGFQLGRISGSS